MKKNKEKNLTITKEEIETNHIVKSNKSYLIVFSILFLAIFLLLVGSLFRTNVTPDYPIVIMGADNKLMVITKDNDLNDITNIDETDIVYANSDIRYILYTDGANLYLLNTTSTDNKILLTEDACMYGFSSDDKFVYYVKNDKDLYIYNIKNKSSILVDTDVTKVLDVSLTNVIYEKDSHLLVKDIDNGEIDIVSKNYDDIILSKDGKSMLYSTTNTENTYNYYLYNFNDFNNEKVLSNVVELLSYNDNFTKFIYTTNSDETINIYNMISDSLASSDKRFVSILDDDTKTKEEKEANKEEQAQVEVRNSMRDYAKNYTKASFDVYYQNKETSTLLASNINKVYVDDIVTKSIIYTKVNWSDTLDLSTFTSLDDFKEALESEKENGLYYQIDTNKESLLKDNVKEDIEVEYSTSEIYFVEDSNLYFSKINSVSKSTTLATLIDSNVTSSITESTSDMGLIYLMKDTDDTNTLKYAKNGKVSIISTNCYEEFKISETENSVYYIKDYADNAGKFMLYNGILNSKIADGVNTFIYINDDLIYATKDYDEETKTCDLYRLNSNSKLELVYKGISKWYDPVTKKIDEEALS